MRKRGWAWTAVIITGIEPLYRVAGRRTGWAIEEKVLGIVAPLGCFHAD